jgi:hypothetical protein
MVTSMFLLALTLGISVTGGYMLYQWPHLENVIYATIRRLGNYARVRENHYVWVPKKVTYTREVVTGPKGPVEKVVEKVEPARVTIIRHIDMLADLVGFLTRLLRLPVPTPVIQEIFLKPLPEMLQKKQEPKKDKKSTLSVKRPVPLRTPYEFYRDLGLALGNLVFVVALGGLVAKGWSGLKWSLGVE